MEPQENKYHLITRTSLYMLKFMSTNVRKQDFQFKRNKIQI